MFEGCSGHRNSVSRLFDPCICPASKLTRTARADAILAD